MSNGTVIEMNVNWSIVSPGTIARKIINLVIAPVAAARRGATPMVTERVRNSDQEFLELELHSDFSRCNRNTHEICMSQIVRA